MNGEPKTEMWYLLGATEDAALYAGFQNGTTRESFEVALENGTVQSTLHRIPVRAGDAMFIPSGRCHAIAAGCLIVEIQQNSDTTYRLYDWDRLGLDGKPRALHIRESLLATDFKDHEPRLATLDGESLVSCEHFDVSIWQLANPRAEESTSGVVFIVTHGAVSCGASTFCRGDWFLLPACLKNRVLAPQGSGATVMRCLLPRSNKAI